MGSIDERAMESLSFVANLTKFLTVSKNADSQDLGNYFPTFSWVVRDFSLELISKDNKEV